MSEKEYQTDYELRVPGHFANMGQHKNINAIINRGGQLFQGNAYSDKEFWIYECRPILKLIKQGKEIVQLPISPLIKGKR